MIIQQGFPAEKTDEIVELYWQAFGAKLGKVMRPETKAKRFIKLVLDPEHALSAVDKSGQLLGVAGFKTHKGALVGGGLKQLWDIYGLGCFWRALLISLLERDVENKRFLMDGIFVTPKARGQGVGTGLLQALYDLGKARGYQEIRLDVIDSNDRARALYEREGFVAIDTHELGPLAHVFAFKSATTMVRAL